jgi:hypothetical protein
MEAGWEYVVWSEYLNNGSLTWTVGGTTPTRLGTSSPSNRSSEFFTKGNWHDATRPTDVDRTTPPGATGRFTFIATAPHVHGAKFVERWRPLAETGGWFGPEAVYDIEVRDTRVPEPAPAQLEPQDGARVTAREVKFFWDAAADNGSGIKEHELFVSASADPADKSMLVRAEVVPAPGTSVTLSGLPDGSLFWWVVARDLGGNEAVSAVRGFTKDATRPSVVEVSPGRDAVVKNVPSAIARLSEPLDANQPTEALIVSRVEGSTLRPVTGTLSVSGVELRLTFDSILSPGDYQAVVSAKVRDTSGNEMGSPHTWRFTVQAPADTPKDNGTGGGTPPVPGAPSILYQQSGPLLNWHWLLVAMLIALILLLTLARRSRRASAQAGRERW